ncbi:hypothetical protein ACXYN8_02525 [Altererythrobacter sp. CAU 1778]
MSELQLWENGQPLGFAAIKFGDPYQVGEWRGADGIGAIDAHEFLLISDLFGRIQEGEFAAIGFRLAPTVSDGPVRIPEHTFEPRPELELVRNDKLQVSGYSYERIRIVPNHEAGCDSFGKLISKISAGRRSTYPKSKTVIAALFQIKSNCSKSAEKLHPDFELEFKRQYPLSEWGIAPPSQRTLRDHLKRFRQELEETQSA